MDIKEKLIVLLICTLSAIAAAGIFFWVAYGGMRDELPHVLSVSAEIILAAIAVQFFATIFQCKWFMALLYLWWPACLSLCIYFLFSYQYGALEAYGGQQAMGLRYGVTHKPLTDPVYTDIGQERLVYDCIAHINSEGITTLSKNRSRIVLLHQSPGKFEWIIRNELNFFRYKIRSEACDSMRMEKFRVVYPDGALEAEIDVLRCFSADSTYLITWLNQPVNPLMLAATIPEYVMPDVNPY